MGKRGVTVFGDFTNHLKAIVGVAIEAPGQFAPGHLLRVGDDDGREELAGDDALALTLGVALTKNHSYLRRIVERAQHQCADVEAAVLGRVMTELGGEDGVVQRLPVHIQAQTELGDADVLQGLGRANEQRRARFH